MAKSDVKRMACARRITRQFPGPRSKELVKRSLMCLPSKHSHRLVVTSARGATLTDVDGNTYLNFNDTTNTLGSGHPGILKVLKDQMKELVHISGATALYEPYVELAETLKNYVPGRSVRIVYCTTGSEACDLAISLSRWYTQKPIILSYLGSYHGKTGTTLGATTVRSSLRKHVKPLISEVLYLPYPYCYRCPVSENYPECDIRCLKSVDETFERTAPPEDVAAVIFEPIQIHGGVVVPPDKYFPALEKMCGKREVMTIDDEVYTGFCKTGRFFAAEHWGIVPSIFCMGKAMGGGMPIAAISADKRIIESCELAYRGSFGSFAGHPLSCVAALENIRVLRREKLAEKAARQGDYIRKILSELSKKSRLMGDVRGKGLLIGVELVKDKKTKNPATNEAGRVVEKAMQKGLLIGREGRYRQVLKLSPPLTITREETDKALSILEEVLKRAQ